MRFSVFSTVIEEIGEDGPYYPEVFQVCAVGETGRRWVHLQQYRDEFKCFDRVYHAEKDWKDNFFTPANSPNWNEIDPVYGSLAYQKRGQEQIEIAREYELEFGPGSSLRDGI